MSISELSEAMSKLESFKKRRNEMTKSLPDSSLKRSKSTIAAEAQTISSAADSHDVSESATEKKTATKPEAENRGPSANVAYWRGRLEAAQESLAAATSQQESIEKELKETGEAAAAIREAATASEDEVKKLQQELKEAELRNEENQRQLEAAEKAESSSLNRSKEATLKLGQALKEEERCRGGHKDASKRLRRLYEAAETRDLATFDEEMVVELLKEIGLPTEVQELFKQNRIHGKHFEEVCCDTVIMKNLGIKGLHDGKRLRHAIAMVTTCGAVKSSRAVLEQVADATGDEALKRARWSVDDVAKWLRSYGVEEKVCQEVRQKGIDGENLLYFEWKDFNELGVPEVGTCLTLQHEMIATKSAFFKAMGARIIGCRAVAGSEAPQPSSGQQAPPAAVPPDERVPDEYRCPITLKIMNDPVLAEDGCFYEREAITMWLSHHNTSPSTNDLMGKNLATVFTLRSAILEYKQRNKQS